jgi:hypothetical protein
MFAARNMLFAKQSSAYDPDAAAYFSRIVANGSTITDDNKTAVDTFVRGCKADGVWSKLKACCLLAGPSTLAGALTALVGSNPTNINFIEASYVRTAGLIGDGTAQRGLNTNRASNADPQDNSHVAAYVTVSAGVSTLINAGDAGSGATSIGTTGSTRSRNSGLFSTATVLGFAGVSRSSSSGYDSRVNGVAYPRTQVSQTPSASNYHIFRYSDTLASYSGARISFYSIGEAIDLALLDARVTTYMNSLT